jgi:hypothetical protein
MAVYYDDGQAGGLHVDVKELLENPRTAAFSRIKYLQSRGAEEEMAEFLNGLFLEAFKAKYSGDWDAFIEWMEGWEDVALTGQFNTMEFPDVEIPWSPISIPLSSATNRSGYYGWPLCREARAFRSRGHLVPPDTERFA